jgi:signal transduction protein with GAF and PtsI domain
MIETLETCSHIADIAPCVRFISIGTNELTAEALGISRQDPDRQDSFRLLPHSVVTLIAETIERARAANPDIHVGLCGEAASNIHSLVALHDAGASIDSFSVAPALTNTMLLPLSYGGHLIPHACEPLSQEEYNMFREGGRLARPGRPQERLSRRPSEVPGC